MLTLPVEQLVVLTCFYYVFHYLDHSNVDLGTWPEIGNKLNTDYISRLCFLDDLEEANFQNQSYNKDLWTVSIIKGI